VVLPEIRVLGARRPTFDEHLGLFGVLGLLAENGLAVRLA
jgi:hypothetical protein